MHTAPEAWLAGVADLAPRPPTPSVQSLWTVTVDVFSPEPSLCGVWDELATRGRYQVGGLLTGLEERPAGCYFDERDGLRAWLAIRVRAHEVDGACQQGQDFVDAILSRAPGEVTRHRRLRVHVAARPSTERSWDREKWLLAPRGGESLPRPVPWSHYELGADGRTLTIVWATGRHKLERVGASENLDRAMITLHERHPPLVARAGTPCVSRPGRRTRRVAVTLRKPLGLREVCDGFDAQPRPIAG